MHKGDFYQDTQDGWKFYEESVGQFAVSIANDLFQCFQYDEAIEASVALNLWMYTVYNLHMSVENCRNNFDDHALHSLNVAAAYWIGEGQENGSNEGHSLYALAEKAHKQDFYQNTQDGWKFDGESVGQFADSIANDLFQIFQYDEAI